MRWAGFAERMGMMRNMYKILVISPEEKLYLMSGSFLKKVCVCGLDSVGYGSKASRETVSFNEPAGCIKGGELLDQ
jgi:hypothetical protein